jgi:predicted transcriptional regulator YheO
LQGFPVGRRADWSPLITNRWAGNTSINETTSIILSASFPSHRANQKRRTQQALRDAALALFDAGQRPTLQEIADKAMVSRATVYRYFSSVEALIHDAAFDRAVA